MDDAIELLSAQEELQVSSVNGIKDGVGQAFEERAFERSDHVGFVWRIINR
jgi:hypothetical protein